MTLQRPLELLHHLILREKLCDVFAVKPLADSAFDLVEGLRSALLRFSPQPLNPFAHGRACLLLLGQIRACKIVRLTQTQLLAAIGRGPVAPPLQRMDRIALPRRLLRESGPAGITTDLIYALMIGTPPEHWSKSIQWRLLPAGVTPELIGEAQEFARWQLLLGETHANQPLLLLAYALPRSRRAAENVLELLQSWAKNLNQNPQVPADEESTFRQVLTLAAASWLSHRAAEAAKSLAPAV